MSVSKFRCTEHIIDCSHVRGSVRAVRADTPALKLAVNQYTPVQTGTPRPGDVTIIAAGCNACPKECYEPLWDEILRVSSKISGFRIRGIWIADPWFQGKSGVLNEAYLGNDPNWSDHARDLLHLTNRFRDLMPPPLIGFGHSIGGTVLTNLSVIHPRLFTSLVLTEPMIKSTPVAVGKMSNMTGAYTATLRKDRWPSREAAAEDFKSQRLYRSWDRRVVDLLATHGVRDSPHPSSKEDRTVILTTLTAHEALGVAVPAYGPWTDATKDSPAAALITFKRNRRQQPLLASGLPHNPRSAFSRPEVMLACTQYLPFLSPPTFYIYGSKALGKEMHADHLELTGTGVGGNGGVKEGAVTSVEIEGAGHFVAFERVEEMAKNLSEHIASSAQRWKAEDEVEREYWRGKEGSSKVLDDEYHWWLHEQFGPNLDPKKKSRL